MFLPHENFLLIRTSFVDIVKVRVCVCVTDVNRDVRETMADRHLMRRSLWQINVTFVVIKPLQPALKYPTTLSSHSVAFVLLS